MKGEYHEKQILLRMKWNTFIRLKRIFPSVKGESAARYFRRLAKWLEENDKNGRN